MIAMSEDLQKFAGSATGCAAEILRAADALEAMSQAMADEILTLGEEHAAALRLKAYLLKA
jgi:hypothetical protein